MSFKISRQNFPIQLPPKLASQSFNCPYKRIPPVVIGSVSMDQCDKSIYFIIYITGIVPFEDLFKHKSFYYVLNLIIFLCITKEHANKDLTFTSQ